MEQNTQRFVAPWASGEKLRKVESEVLIPNLMKKKAKVLCQDYMKAFDACSKGRVFSLMWSCKGEVQALRNCISNELEKPDLYSEAKLEYLKEREKFQEEYVETGSLKKKKKEIRKEEIL
ncbi:COX assembly mitochondrial protein homolog [Hydra vulgaris]|nr:COX assembly mitochondrial protein homolog [Hydra vulgaris]